MSPLPLSAFPIASNPNSSGGFVVAVLIGLTIFLATKNKAANNG